MTKLVTKIVDNLQFEIHNVHIRFEDFDSSKNVRLLVSTIYTFQYPFAFGICLSSLTARSTDENWVEMFIEDRKDKFMYKVHSSSHCLIVFLQLAKLNHLSAYFDPIATPTDAKGMVNILKAGVGPKMSQH